MSKLDELAILPANLVPLHPFVDHAALDLLLRHFVAAEALCPPNTPMDATGTRLLTKAIFGFVYKHSIFEKLSINIEQLVWIIYLFVDSFSHGDNNSNSLTATGGIKKPHIDILSNLIPVHSPFTEDDRYYKVLTENNHVATQGGCLYNDLLNSYRDKTVSLNHLFDWLLKFVGVVKSTADKSLVERQRSLLYKSYNIVKVAAIIHTSLEMDQEVSGGDNNSNGHFNGFLPIPHHMLNGISHFRYDSQSQNNNDLFTVSLANKMQAVNTNELVVILKKKLFKDAPIYLDNVEIVTMDEFHRRTRSELSSIASSTSSAFGEDHEESENVNYDLIPNEELLLYYGYTLDDYDYLMLGLPIHKTLVHLQASASDREELDREVLLMRGKLRILKEIGVSESSIGPDGMLTLMLTRDKPLGINLLEVARVSKLREAEAYFYEPGQATTSINYRNELETLVYLSDQLRGILSSIMSVLKNILLCVSSESCLALPTELERYYQNHQIIIQNSLQQLTALKNAHCKTANKQVSFVKPIDAVYKKFERWLQEGGVQFPKLQIANFNDSTGRGLVTTKRVDENECIVSVPRKYLINVDVAKNHEILGKIFEEVSGLNDDTILFLFVIYEKENPNSFWRPFFDTLPSYFPTSIHYTATELLELEGTNLFAETLRTKEHLQSIMDLLFPELSNQFPNVFPESLFTWENFLWARSLFDSRAIQLKIDGKIVNCLVPMADMINHNTHAQISRRHFDQDSDCFRMVSCCGVPANAQIFLHYGALQNWELAHYYGFVMPNNCYDSMHIGFDMPEDETPKLTENKLKLLDSNLISIDTHYLRKGDIPLRILAALRVALLAEEEFNEHLDIWNPITRRNEELVLQTLYSTILMLLKQFSSTWEEDQKLCEQLTEDSLKPFKNTRDLAEEDEEDTGDQQSSEQMKIVLQYPSPLVDNAARDMKPLNPSSIVGDEKAMVEGTVTAPKLEQQESSSSLDQEEITVRSPLISPRATSKQVEIEMDALDLQQVGIPVESLNHEHRSVLQEIKDTDSPRISRAYTKVDSFAPMLAELQRENLDSPDTPTHGGDTSSNSCTASPNNDNNNSNNGSIQVQPMTPESSLKTDTRIDLENTFPMVFFSEVDKISQFYNERYKKFKSKSIELCNMIPFLKSHPHLRTSRNIKYVKEGFQDCYRLLVMLSSYRSLNKEGFDKLLFKYKRYIYARYFTGNDTKLAKAEMKKPLPGEHRANVFVVGGLIGICVMLIILSVYNYVYYFPQDNPPDYSPLAWLLFRITLLPIMLGTLFSLQTFVWERTGINYVFIFELKPEYARSSLRYLKFGLVFITFWLICLYFFIETSSKIMDSMVSPLVFPIVFLCGTIAISVMPFPVFASETRFWVLKRIGKVISAPFIPVRFADFFMSVQLLSLGEFLFNIQSMICVFNYSTLKPDVSGHFQL
eukprot:gene4239-4946_t